jgi:hypothetical protein
MKSGEQILIVTPKGVQELRDRTSRLEVTAKDVLTLIEQGYTSTDAILQRSMFPHNAVVDALRRLLSNKLVAVAGGEGGSKAGGSAVSGMRSSRGDLRLKFGVSPSHARFALSNFCMDEFGTEGQYFVDAVSLCSDFISLQEVLNSICASVDESCPNRFSALVQCVREINETDENTGSLPVPDAAKTAAPVAKPAANTAPPIRPAYVKSVPTPAAVSDSGTLELNVSLAQGRFALSEFCLNQFGVRGQELVDAVNRCGDVPALQKVLNLIRTEVQSRHKERLPALMACVREINDTAL